MNEKHWKRWVLCGALAGALGLAGCEEQREGPPGGQGNRAAELREEQLANPDPGMERAGTTTGGAEGVPGSRGTPAIPGAPIDSVETAPTDAQGTPEVGTALEEGTPLDQATGGAGSPDTDPRPESGGADPDAASRDFTPY